MENREVFSSKDFRKINTNNGGERGRLSCLKREKV